MHDDWPIKEGYFVVVQVATVKVQQGKESEFESLVKSILPMVKQEKGTLQYVMHRSQEEFGKYLFYEIYADQEAKEVHLAKTYVKEMINTTSDLLSEKPSIALYEEITF